MFEACSPISASGLPSQVPFRNLEYEVHSKEWNPIEEVMDSAYRSSARALLHPSLKEITGNVNVNILIVEISTG